MKHQKVLLKTEIERSTNMYKYEKPKRFHHDCQLQVYMYAFMYDDPQTMKVEANLSPTETFVVRYKKLSTPGPAPKHWMRFSYILSEDYELYHNFDDTELKNKPDNTSNDNVFIF